MSLYYLNRNILSMAHAYQQWSDERNRGIVHTTEYDAEMERVLAELRKFNEDVQIVGRVDAARAELPQPTTRTTDGT